MRKFIIYIICIILIIGLATAARRTSYVDNYFTNHSLYEITNISIIGIFTDGVLSLSSGNIINALQINASAFYQAGNLTLDTGDLAGINASSEAYTDIAVSAANTSMRNYVNAGISGSNTSMRNYVNATVDAANASMNSFVRDTFLNYSDEGNLNVNSSEYWDSLNTPTDFTTVGTYGVTDYAGDLVNATVMYENGQEVATLNDLVTGNVTVTSIVAVKNVDGTTADKGAVMRFTGYNAGVERYDVIKAGNTNPEHHADCLMFSSTANNANGLCVIFGMVTEMDTDEWNELDMLFVNETNGTLTDVRPSTANCVQMIVQVMRSHSTVGTLRVHGSGRCNDVPNNFSITGNISANYIDGNMSWKHQSYPSPCSSYYALTEIGDSNTCTYGIDLINWSDTLGKVTIYGENITSGTVADARIAETLARDSELIQNCTLEASCPLITYDTEIAYISNCSVVDSCPNLYYLGGLSGENITIGTVADARIAETLARDSEVVLKTGGIFSGAVNITNNLTQYSHQYHCFNAACSAYIYDNGSSLVIKVN